jgi:hypothetical protein
MQLSGFGDTGVVEQVAPPGLAVTVYDTSGEPFAELAAQETVTWVSPRTPVTDDGAVGTPAGVTPLEAADDAEVPAALVAVTVKVYDVPLVKPVTVHEVVADVHVSAPGFDVTV